LGDFIHPLESDSKYVLRLKVDKQLFRMRQDVIFGIVYIPPENSIYCTGDPFSEMENEFLNYSAN
jgi:glutamine cyclotransferase